MLPVLLAANGRVDGHERGRQVGDLDEHRLRIGGESEPD